MSAPATRSGRLPALPVPVQHEHQTRAKWTTTLTKALVDVMVEQIQQRNSHKISTGNKWKFICDGFYNRTGLRWDREQLKYRCTVLRKLHVTVKSLLDRSEFTWNETTGALTAKDETWDEYIKEHPDADTLRSSGCPFYKQLCIIYSELGGTENANKLTEKGGRTDPVSNFTEDCSTESEEVAEVANEQEKPQCVDITTFLNRKRGRKGCEDMMAGAILEMAAASRMRVEAIQQCSQRYSISKCVNALDELHGIDEKVYFAALDLFNNPIARETFLSLKVEKRLMWLQGKCRLPSSS